MSSIAPVDPLFNAKSYEAQITAIRETVKWHFVTASAIVALLLGGLKFSSFGAISPWAFAFVFVMAIIAFATVSVMIILCGVVLSVQRPSLDKLLRDKKLRDAVEDGPILLFRQYGDVALLARCHGEEAKKYGEKYLIITNRGHVSLRPKAPAIEDDAERIFQCRLAAYEVLTYAHLLKVQEYYNRSLIALGIGLTLLLTTCTIIVRFLGPVSGTAS